jgi:hypothetical protein
MQDAGERHPQESGGFRQSKKVDCALAVVAWRRSMRLMHSILGMALSHLVRLELKRRQVSEFFANRQPALVAMEGCGNARHWDAPSLPKVAKSDCCPSNR